MLQWGLKVWITPATITNRTTKLIVKRAVANSRNSCEVTALAQSLAARHFSRSCDSCRKPANQSDVQEQGFSIFGRPTATHAGVNCAWRQVQVARRCEHRSHLRTVLVSARAHRTLMTCRNAFDKSRTTQTNGMRFPSFATVPVIATVPRGLSLDIL